MRAVARQRLFAVLLFVAAFGLFGIVVLWNYVEIWEAFSWEGPHRGRTENMDKWRNPIPILVPIDIAALLLVFILVRKAVRITPSG